MTAGTTQMASSAKGKTLEWHPEGRQGGELVPVHEIRNARRRLNGGGDRVRRFQLQEHRHAIAAEAEEDALAEAEHAAAAPEQDEPDGDEAVAEVFPHQVQAGDIGSASGRIDSSRRTRN